MDSRRRGCRRGCLDVGGVLIDVSRISRNHADVAVDTSARIKTRCRLRTGVGLDRNHVFRPKLDTLCHVVAEAHVAVGMVPELSAVNVDGAVPHDAVEFNVDLLARRHGCGKREMVSVPADPRRYIGASAGGCGTRIEWPLDRPVVREVNRTPSGISKGCSFRPACVTLVEQPAPVEGHDDSDPIPRLNDNRTTTGAGDPA